MAKLSRTALKSLVKECLIELLAEGLDNSEGNMRLSESISRPKIRKPQNKKRISSRPALDHIVPNGVPETLKPMIESADPVMAAIFTDTANSTLLDQMSAERGKRNISSANMGDEATKTMSSSDPMNIFEGANNWEALAFDNSSNTSK